MKKSGFDTKSIHAGYETPEGEFGACSIPVYHANAFVLDDADQAAALFAHEQPGHFYGRVSNPTVEALEKRLAALEGGVGALCTSSGMAALSAVITTLTGAGDHIVASRALYGGNYKLLGHVMKRFGVGVTFVDPRDTGAFEKALTPQTKLIFGEIIGNPGLEILDVPVLSKIAKKADVPLVVDATFTTPYLCQAFEHGADIVIHSVTKWLGGHGIAIGGAVIDSGNFDWSKTPEKFPVVAQACPWQEDLNYCERYGKAGFIEAARVQAVRLLGACMSPMSAFHLMLGIETLSLRMEKHVANTLAVAQFLSQQPAVEWVNYPGLAGHPDFALGQKLMPRGAGGVIALALKGDAATALKFIKNLKIFKHLSNVGDTRSLVLMPSHTTQKGVSGAASDNWIRLSIGLEDQADLKADISQALEDK